MFNVFGKKDQTSTARFAAMDVVQANIMIADENLRIVYINPSVEALLRDAESDLKKELPRFNVATLVGSSIDVFHKNPEHQQRMLRALDRRHRATIKVGAHQFDLVVSPLTDKGRRIGYAVEWANARDRLLNLDYAAQIAAFHRSQAIIEFATDGTILSANDNFLKAVGYDLSEIQGRNHSLFMDPGQIHSDEYRRFWEQLRQGRYQSGQFQRVGKNGKVIWLECSYNPILDGKGQVAKVVKIATDITAQIDLFRNLKLLIDRNFGEIDQSVDQSSHEARSASMAADQTSGNVQMVAASAEELAASIAEIAQSMSKSRVAADTVHRQATDAEACTEKLTATAQAMTGIVGLIQNIASQINLLALNATIEAARAGEAGKGFAVVASEVKSLANQAAKATEKIAAEIDGIQSTSGDVVQALDAIRGGIMTVRDYVATTAAAIEEQSSVTQSMSGNMQAASNAVQSVTTSITEISAAVGQVAQAVSRTKEAAAVLAR